MKSKRPFLNTIKEGDQKGMVLVMVMGFVLLMSLSTITFTSVIKRDIELIQRAKLSEQARNVAEAGVHHALAKLKADGFSAMADFSASLDSGDYSVTHESVGTRLLIVSEGTVSGTSKIVSVEVERVTPEVLDFIFAGGNNLRARAMSPGTGVTIEGDIHSNNWVELRLPGNRGYINITTNDYPVRAVGEIRLDNGVSINGVTTGWTASEIQEGADRVNLSIFDNELGKYKQDAIDSGDHYIGDRTFSNMTLSPDNGVVYVEGDVTISGNVTINGGIVADSIQIDKWADFVQSKAGDRNVIIATTGDISIKGDFTTEEAIVYAKRDISTQSAHVAVDITGVIIAERDIKFWNVQTEVSYKHKWTAPSDLIGADEEGTVRVISWNR